MNNRKSRSSLKKVTVDVNNEADPARAPRRRISFSGKKFVREFDTTEKARDYDNSYEISDHTNGDDSSGQSHGHTAPVSALQITGYVSMANEMDKENTPLASDIGAVSTEYDQHYRNESSLQLQTSVNVTLMPHEIAKKRQLVELCSTLEYMQCDSLSLSDLELEKLRKNSIFKNPVSDKTIDLLPSKMVFDKLEAENLDKQDVQPTVEVPKDISCVAQPESSIKQKTVLFGNNTIIAHDFSDIEPQEDIAAVGVKTGPTREFDSFNMDERDCMSFLPDDSTSSPLIPLDVISENGIGRKLNFCQLMDALNSGRIQLFPNGPKTPTTDRKATQQRFWHGLEQQGMDQELPLRDTIKPRGTLNFNESMIMSPVHEQKLNQTNEPAKAKKNYRFSQADELMLDNTNFLVHAKVGDETQSRNSSKSTSRRETTYDNTAMELDDLEKQEAAVAAALENAKLRPTLLRMEEIDEDNVPKPTEICGFSRTTQMNQSIEEECLNPQEKLSVHQAQKCSKPRQTLLLSEPIEEDILKTQSAVSAVEHQSRSRRRTLLMAESIEEDSFCSTAPTSAHDNRPRTIMHLAQPIEVDIIRHPIDLKSQAGASASDQHGSRRRQTLLLADPIEEDSFCSNSIQTAVPEASHPSMQRKTMHMAEPIEEEEMREFQTQDLGKQSKINKQNVEDLSISGGESQLNFLGLAVKHQGNKQRQTIHMAEPIEEDIVRSQKEFKSQLKAPEQKFSIRRQTLHLSEDIEDDNVNVRLEPQLNIFALPVEQQSSKRRQTMHRAEPIEEECLSIAPTVEQRYSTRGQTLQTSEEMATSRLEMQLNPFAPLIEEQKNRRRQTRHMAEHIEEDIIKSQNDLKPQATKPLSRRKQSLLLADPIEDDSFCVNKDLMPIEVKRKPRQTLLLAEAIDEEPLLVPSSQTEELNILKYNEKHNIGHQMNSKPRQTLHLSENIEEEICSASQELHLQAAPSMGQPSKQRRQTIIRTEAMEEDGSYTETNISEIEAIDKEMPDADLTKAHSSKPRLTFLQSESMDMEMLSFSSNANKAAAEDGSPSDSSEWLAQMHTKARQAFSSPNTKFTKTIMETPKMKKIPHQHCFPITPGRSMIEYEELEEQCNHDSPLASARSVYQASEQLYMDLGTPIAAIPRVSINDKRMPIHLTPNLPQPKKRHTQLLVEREEPNFSRPPVDETREDEEMVTPTASKSKSRIPVLSKTLNLISSPCREPEQLDDTVQMVRAQMMRQTRSGIELVVSHTVENKTISEEAAFEGNAITISDVSKHFVAQQKIAEQSGEQTKDASEDRRSSTERSHRSYAKAHQKFMNLSGDTVIFDAAEIIDLESDDEIEKTRLCLVSTLLDEEDDNNDDSDLEFAEDDKVETCLEQVNPPAVAGSVDACKKCTHCRRSINETNVSTSKSFAVSDWNAIELGLERLERLRQQPSLSDVQRYWEIKELERSNTSDETTSERSPETNEPDSLTVAQMLEIFNQKIKENRTKLPAPERTEPFEKRLESKLKAQLPHWIFDYNLQYHRQYIFSHTRITTYGIMVDYEPLDALETEIRIRNIRGITANHIPKANWTVYEHLMDFQLRLKLPINLLNLLEGNHVDDILKLLEHIDRLCMETARLCTDMHLALIPRQARLLRQPNRNVVRKIVTKQVQVKDELYVRVEKIYFVIEIGNVEDISFKDILQPPLHQFDEKIQLLPKGITFLKALLDNPEQYLKPSVELNTN